MKKISDLLDDYSDMELNIETQTPLSSERIRELTMSKIENKNKKPKRMTFRVLIAAAVIMMLTVSVIAAGTGAEWFVDFFTEQSDSEMSSEQVEYINENAVAMEESQTIDGYDVILDSYISDGSTTYAKIRIKTPEASEVSCDSLVFEDGPWLYRDGEPLGGASASWKLLKCDETSGDGIYLLRYELIEACRDNAQTGNVELVMSNLISRDDREQCLAEGTWRFDLNIPETEVLELVDGPIAKVEAYTEESECIEVELVSVGMTAMGLQIEFVEPTTSDPFAVYYFLGVKAVMHDGKEVLLREKSFGNVDSEEGTMRWIYFEPQSPTPLDEVQYIEFPGGVQVPVNAE